jgi:hypothetical protein
MSQRDPQRMLEGAGRKHLIRITDDLCAKWTPVEKRQTTSKVRDRRRRSNDDRRAVADGPAHDRVHALTVSEQTSEA